MTGKQLKQIRRRLGWTQKQLAEVVGIAPNTLACEERGVHGISEPVATLIRLVAEGKLLETPSQPRPGRRASAFIETGA